MKAESERTWRRQVEGERQQRVREDARAVFARFIAQQWTVDAGRRVAASESSQSDLERALADWAVALAEVRLVASPTTVELARRFMSFCLRDEAPPSIEVSARLEELLAAMRADLGVDDP
jgi:hypothetical protein